MLDRRSTRSRSAISEVVEPGREWVTVFKRTEDAGGRWEGSPELSSKLAKRAEGYGFSARRVSAELERRTTFLDQLVGKGVCDHESLSRELRRFYAPSSSTLTF